MVSRIQVFLAALVRSVCRHPSIVLNAVLLVAVAGATYWRFGNAPWFGKPTPADLFMQSVATEDGALGWNQLCPALQVQLPRDVLQQQTEKLRSDHLHSGVTLTIEHIGDRPRAGGGQIRVYVATLRAADGSTGEKTYVVETQANGCVESVQ